MTVLKILLVLYVACEFCQAYHHYGSDQKWDRRNSPWYGNGLSSSSSLSKSPWYRNNHRYGTTTTTTTTTEVPHRIRHSGSGSRYPKLDSVIHRLNPSKRVENTASLHTPKKSSYRHMWDSYYEDNDYDEDDVLESNEKDDDISEGDKWNDDNHYDNDYTDEDDYFDDDEMDEEIRDEEVTDSPPTSSLTAYKWKHFGSRDGVEKSRNLQMQHMRKAVEDPMKAAEDHQLKVLTATKCHAPIPKVVPATNSINATSGTSYMPHCTVLHRCSEDSGCCQAQGTKCGPKRETIVELYFYAQSRNTARVEKLAFYNHTECACISTKELATLNDNAAHIVSTVLKKPISLKSSLTAENLIRCQCPTQFSPNLRYTSYCSCTCPNNNIDCERMQRGMEYLSLKDRACIKNSECSSPVCEYGKYLKEVGRCPRKHEKYGN